jgi:predicted CopG family antitoxin
MATNNIAISEEAYRRLKKLKLPGDSFTDVLLRELPDPCGTCGEVLESFKTRPVPKADPKLREAMLRGRGRRSSRQQ